MTFLTRPARVSQKDTSAVESNSKSGKAKGKKPDSSAQKGHKCESIRYVCIVKLNYHTSS
jgi:hypothetical protein